MDEFLACGNCGHPTFVDECPICGVSQSKLDELREFVAAHGDILEQDIFVPNTFPREWINE